MHIPPLTKTPKSQLSAELPLGEKKKTGTYQKRYFTSRDKATTRWSESPEPQVRLPSLTLWHQEEESSEHLALKAGGA